MNTTLYNHKELCTATKELIPNLVFKETIDDLRAGNTGLYELVVEEYRMEPFQKQFLEGIYATIK